LRESQPNTKTPGRKPEREEKKMTKTTILKDLKEMYGDVEGPMRLHWEGDDTEAKSFDSLETCLDEVAQKAIEQDVSAKQIERIAYIVTEADYQSQEEEYRQRDSQDE
jgi:hypothetical protein